MKVHGIVYGSKFHTVRNRWAVLAVTSGLRFRVLLEEGSSGITKHEWLQALRKQKEVSSNSMFQHRHRWLYNND